MKKLIVFVLAVSVILNCGCGSDKWEKNTLVKSAETVIKGYLAAMSAHNISEIEKYVSDEWKNKYLSDEEYIVAFVDTVESCENIRVDIENIKTIDENQIEVPVKYILTYSEEYIPVGTLEIGENEMDNIFVLEKQENGQYVIVRIRSAQIQ